MPFQLHFGSRNDWNEFIEALLHPKPVVPKPPVVVTPEPGDDEPFVFPPDPLPASQRIGYDQGARFWPLKPEFTMPPAYASQGNPAYCNPLEGSHKYAGQRATDGETVWVAPYELPRNIRFFLRGGTLVPQ